jgi:hypothetical protein
MHELPQPPLQPLQQHELITDDERIVLCWNCGNHLNVGEPSGICCDSRPVRLGFILTDDGKIHRRTVAEL